jgi:hypothetical protein
MTKIFQGTFLEQHWLEFSRTLHAQAIKTNGKTIVQEHRVTAPADNFFTAASVIDKSLKVHYFKHLPGILTGVGIIGTFSGLLFGLSNFDATSPETVSLSVALLLSGVRDAFFASAFAITAAMVITHVEKLHYQICLARLGDLVESINRMFREGVLEDYLGIIANSAISKEEQTAMILEEISSVMNPLVTSLEKSQMEFSKIVFDAIRQTMDSANLKLAAQIESALNRQLRIPIENLTDRLTHANKSHNDQSVNRSERLRKIADSQKASLSSNLALNSSEILAESVSTSYTKLNSENANLSKISSS